MIMSRSCVGQSLCVLVLPFGGPGQFSVDDTVMSIFMLFQLVGASVLTGYRHFCGGAFLYIFIYCAQIDFVLRKLCTTTRYIYSKIV